MNSQAAGLRAFLDNAHSFYHATQNVIAALEGAGYAMLTEADAWTLTPGGKYYVVRGGSSVIAFRIPESTPCGFLISASHTDHPCFKLKLRPELPGRYTRIAVEKYGSAILYPWLDRPLSIAGRVFVRTDDGARVKLIDLDRDLLLIPSVAIHMNRKINDGYVWDLSKDLTPLFGSENDAGKLGELLTEAAGGEIIGHDLYLYVRQKSCVWGVDEQFISAPALDDLQCVYGSMQGFLHAEPSKGSIAVFCALDSEEIGSVSAQGAGSTFLEDTLRRISLAIGVDARQLLAQSFLVSADNAHALHPNHPELADPGSDPILGGGIVLKFNSSLRYCTDGIAAGVFQTACHRAGVPVQVYYNRGGISGGSTLGHISIPHVSVPTADIGLPQLAMHSCYETAAVQDSEYLEKAMRVYFGGTLYTGADGFRFV